MRPKKLDHKGAIATLWQKDARTFLRSLPAESVDLIATSPPYFVGKEYDRSISSDDFIREIRRILPAAAKALKPGGSLCWQVGNHVADAQLIPLDFLVGTAMARRPEFILANG